MCEDLRVEIWTLDENGHWDSSELAENHDVTCTETLVEGTIYDVPEGKIGALVIPTVVPEGVEVVENKATVSVVDQTDEPGAETLITDAGGAGDGNEIVTPPPSETPETPETPESPTPSQTPDTPAQSETPESPAPSETSESPAPSPSETTDAPAPPPEDDEPESPRLPRTGTNTALTLGLGTLLVAGGATALIAARRRA